MKTRTRRMIGALLGLGSLVALAVQLPAQVAEGKRFELSTSVSIWDALMDLASAYILDQIDVPIRVGLYVYKGLEVEPELFLTIPTETGDIGILAFGNLAYNFRLSPKAWGFILGGVGKVNGAQVYGYDADRQNRIFALDFGAGLKRMIARSAAVRLEYRVISYFEEGKHLWNDQTVLAGFSVFF